MFNKLLPYLVSDVVFIVIVQHRIYMLTYIKWGLSEDTYKITSLNNYIWQLICSKGSVASLKQGEYTSLTFSVLILYVSGKLSYPKQLSANVSMSPRTVDCARCVLAFPH